MTDSFALYAHIISQTRQNIDFLAAQNKISQDDARDIISKLPSAADPSVLALSQQTHDLAVTPNDAVSAFAMPTPGPGALTRRNVPPPQPQRPVQQAMALWGYNEQEQDPNDLSFYKGDIIEIVSETNADWWTGKSNGRQGLFPSNYVQKLPMNPSSAPTLNPTLTPSTPSVGSPSSTLNPYTEKVYAPPPGPPIGYAPPAANYQQDYRNQQPPNNQQLAYNPYMNPPGPVNQPPPPAIQQAPAEPPKKNRFGGDLGNTLAHSAVGGVGFGAGSAIGSGIINSIF